MCERKIWKLEEDEILKEIYQIRQIKRWSEIAKIMEKEYAIQGRNGKQCRERYHNHLKGGINKEKWLPNEENDLIHLHAEHGNRWALISKLIPGRSQNSVKNMLYSRMRRSIRMLNRFIFQHCRKQLKEIKISFIYRLIDFTEKAYKKPLASRNEQQIISIRLKNDLLMLEYNESESFPEDKDYLKKLIADIHVFKRVNQRYRGNTTAKKVQKLSKIQSECKQSDANIKVQEPVINGDKIPLKMAEHAEKKASEKQSTNSIIDLTDHHCTITKVTKLDSLDGTLPFLQFREQGLELPIPLEIEVKGKAELENAHFVESAINNWQAYFD